MCAKKKHPLIVREPVFLICVNVGKYVITINPVEAMKYFEKGSTVKMNALQLNHFGLVSSKYDGIVKSSNFVAIRFMPRSNCWKVRTDDEVYHIVNW